MKAVNLSKQGSIPTLSTTTDKPFRLNPILNSLPLLFETTTEVAVRIQKRERYVWMAIQQLGVNANSVTEPALHALELQALTESSAMTLTPRPQVESADATLAGFAGPM
jgi:hypothetical protein